MQFPLSLDLLLFWLGFSFFVFDYTVMQVKRLLKYKCLETFTFRKCLFIFSPHFFHTWKEKRVVRNFDKKQSRKKVSKLLGNRLIHSLHIHEIQQRYHSKLKTRKVLWVGASIQIKFCNGDKMKALW